MIYTGAIKLGPRGCKIFHYTGRDEKYEAINVKQNKTCLSLLDRNEILSPLRSLGRFFEDPIVQEDIKSWPNEVINQNNKPMFRVGQNCDETTTLNNAEEIVSWMLEAGKTRIKELAGEDDYSAILIVPNDFNEAQLESMKVSIKLSDIKIKKIVNQATAVAFSLNALHNQINYEDYNDDDDGNENIYNVVSDCPLSQPPTSPLLEGGLYLFVHLGSYSLDVSVINYDKENELIEIKMESGDSSFGSIDFTRRMNSAVKEFCQKQNIACERNWIPWKIHLNLLKNDEVRLIPLQYKDMLQHWKRESLEESILQLRKTLEHAFDPLPLKRKLKKKEKKLKQLGPIDSSRYFQLTRAIFERQCCDLFDRVAQQIEMAVKEAGTDRSSYRQIKLYGGGAISWLSITDIVCSVLPNTPVDYDKIPEDLDSPDSWSFLSSFGQASYDLLGAACLAHVLENDGQTKTDNSQNGLSHSKHSHVTKPVPIRKARLINGSMKSTNVNL